MKIHNGDEVAVLKQPCDLPSDVVKIGVVQHAGPLYIQLQDGRVFAALGGIGLNTSECIVPVREEHRAALRKNGDRQ